MEVLITSHVKVFLGNKNNSYIHTARNTKVTSTRNLYEKTVMNPLKHLVLETNLYKKLSGSSGTHCSIPESNPYLLLI